MDFEQPHQFHQFEYMADEGDMSDFVEDVDDEENVGRDMLLDDYETLNQEASDTSAAQARKGKDCQGIPWERLTTTKEKYRKTRLETYKNYENIPSSGEIADKKFQLMLKGGNYYEFFHNTRLVKPTILHFQLRNLVWATSKHDVYLMSNYSVVHWSYLSGKGTDVINFSGHIAPTERHPGNLLEGFMQTQISTLAVKDNFLVAGGFQGELTCKVCPFVQHGHQSLEWERITELLLILEISGI